MNIYLLENCEHALWHKVIALYIKSFPEWEREAVADIETNIANGDSFCVVATDKGATDKNATGDEQVVGAYICDVNSELKFLLLSYVFVDEKYRGQGIGSKLCDHLKQHQLAHAQVYCWLFLETEPHNKGFYLKLGYSQVDIDYLSPHFDSDESTPMSLMVSGTAPLAAITQAQMRAIITNFFTHGYGLSEDSERLRVQLDKVPEQIQLVNQ